MKRYSVRVEVYVGADHPDEAIAQVERLMASVTNAPWLVRHVRGMTPSDERLLKEKRHEGEDIGLTRSTES